MMKARRYVWIATLGSLLAAASLGSQGGPLKNHSFDVDGAGATVCLDGALFSGGPTAASALNLQMTAQVFEQTGTTAVETGNSHVFTSTSETFTFSVLYPTSTFTAGDTIVLTITDQPGTVSGTQGDAATATVGDCSLPRAPTLPGWGVAMLALLLAGSGWIVARGGPRESVSA